MKYGYSKHITIILNAVQHTSSYHACRKELNYGKKQLKNSPPKPSFNIEPPEVLALDINLLGHTGHVSTDYHRSCQNLKHTCKVGTP